MHGKEAEIRICLSRRNGGSGGARRQANTSTGSHLLPSPPLTHSDRALYRLAGRSCAHLRPWSSLGESHHGHRFVMSGTVVGSPAFLTCVL